MLLSLFSITGDFLKQGILNSCFNLTKLNLSKTIIGDKGIFLLHFESACWILTCAVFPMYFTENWLLELGRYLLKFCIIMIKKLISNICTSCYLSCCFVLKMSQNVYLLFFVFFLPPGIVCLKVPNLQYLNLDCTHVHQHILDVIEKNCPQLRKVIIVTLSSLMEDDEN